MPILEYRITKTQWRHADRGGFVSYIEANISIGDRVCDIKVYKTLSDAQSARTLQNLAYNYAIAPLAGPLIVLTEPEYEKRLHGYISERVKPLDKSSWLDENGDVHLELEPLFQQRKWHVDTTLDRLGIRRLDSYALNYGIRIHTQGPAGDTQTRFDHLVYIDFNHGITKPVPRWSERHIKP